MDEFEDMVEEAPVRSGNQVAAYVEERFRKSEDARYNEEDRWIRAYRNYRGIYGPDVQFTETEKSRVFVKVTKTKVLAASGQITEVLLGNNKFPITIDRTILPEGIEESVHFETNPQLEQVEQQGTSGPTPRPELLPGETYDEFLLRLGGMEEELEPVKDKLKAGPGTSPTAVTFHPADIAAKKMEKKIHDQLDESKASKHLRSSAFECALFGTGIMKGPFAYDKEYPNWDDEGNYDPVIKTIPMVSYTSIWNFYPDSEANNMDEAEYVVERHKMSKTQLRNLVKRPHFREEAIEKALEYGPSYEKKWWELVMEDDSTSIDTERYEVLEFWGNIDQDIVEQYNITVPSEHKNKDTFSVNVWVCNGEVLRIVFNPFTPVNIPYYAFPYEINPYSFFGIGVAENMEDTQMLMNGFMRMAVDNAALSGNLVFEVDSTNLEPGQDLSVYPGKVFRRQGGAPGQAIFGTKFPNVSNENMQMFDKARVLADESTGFPSFAHGQTGVSGVGRTASGISMLMSAANGSIRTVVKNVDDYLLAPLGKAMFSFNMQFDFDPEIKGDLEVKAAGTQSLMANEVRSQRLMQFLGVVQNPVLAPFAKMDYIIREIAISMDLDPDKVTNSMQKAAIQAEILKQFQGQQPPGMAPEGAPNAPAGVQVQDTQGSGGGMMGTGTAPGPGEPGFSGNTGALNENV
jgi:hypothetical protein